MKEHISAVKRILSYSSFNVNMDYADVSKCAFLKRVIEASKYTTSERAERDERHCANACIPLLHDVVLSG